MTCFWSGILSSLNTDDFNYINEPSKPNIKNFIELLKRNNIDTKNVLWQNTKLTPKQLEENKEHIRDFNIENINSGYLCSICDPFLLLIALVGMRLPKSLDTGGIGLYRVLGMVLTSVLAMISFVRSFITNRKK